MAEPPCKGWVDAYVTAPYGKAIANTTWTVAGDPRSGQDYSQQQGSTPYLIQPVVTVPNNGNGAPSDSILYNWGAEQAVLQVNATVAYTDGTSGSATIDCNVVEPTVDSFTDLYTPFQFLAGNGAVGFYDGQNINGTPGQQFQASVSTPAEPTGKIYQFAIIQKINAQITNQDTGGGTGPAYGFNTNGYVLDDTGGQYIYGSRITRNITPQTSMALVPGPTVNDYITDSPRDTSAILRPNGEVPTSLSANFSFSTYLVFQVVNSNGTGQAGAWVPLSYINWEVSGTASMKSGVAQTALNAEMANNWNVTTSPNAAQTISGTPNNGYFVEWNDYASKYFEAIM